MMKLEWLEDLLAVIDHGSLSKAAVARHLTQPAFSRRIRAVEQHLGCELFDRNRKPLLLNENVLELEPSVRDCVSRLRELTQNLQRGADAEPQLVMACQHSISTAVAPAMITQLASHIGGRIRLRSANRDECFAMVVKGQAGMAVVYQTVDEAPLSAPSFIESSCVGQDELIAVVSSDSAASYQREKRRRDKRRPEMAIIAYPEDVYLGKVFRQKILPTLAGQFHVRWNAETALTTAAVEFARSGAGIAWVPRSLVVSHLQSGELLLPDSKLPRVLLHICMLKLAQSTSGEIAAAQEWLSGNRLPIN